MMCQLMSRVLCQRFESDSLDRGAVISRKLALFGLTAVGIVFKSKSLNLMFSLVLVSITRRAY